MKSLVLVSVVLTLVLPAAAFAYIGPGAGIGAIGTLVALVGAVILAIVGFIWYPIRRLIRGRSNKAKVADNDTKAGQ